MQTIFVCVKLTAKQQKFCEEYLIDLNATQAAIRAGYSKKTARVIGMENLTKPAIQQYLQEKGKKLQEKFEITQEEVLRQYQRMAWSDPRNFYNDGGSIKPITELDYDTAVAMAGFEVDEIYIKGEYQGLTKKIKLVDRKGALDSICRILGFNAPDKIEHSGALDFRTFLMRNNKVKK